MDLSNPQSWNRYAYVLNNPLRAVDPLGLDCVYLNDAGDGVEHIELLIDASGCWGSGGYWADGWVGGGSWVTTDPNSNNIWITSSINGFLGNTYAGSNVNGGPAFSQGPFGLGDYSSFTTYQPTPIGTQLPGGGGAGSGGSNPGSSASPSTSPKWWPSKDTSTCSVYPPGGILHGVCANAGNGPRANSMRGCLQEFWMGDGYLPTVFLPATTPGSDTIGLVDNRYGIGAHGYCLPMGFIQQ